MKALPMKALTQIMLTPQPGNIRLPQAAGHRTLALLGSLCLFLSAIEYLIPKPLPFMRIGLANLPLLLALDIFGLKHFSLLVLLKVLCQGIIGRSLFSYIFLFSVAGTFSSAAVMYALRQLAGKQHLGFAGLGCAGAMASNITQLILARYFIFGSALRYLIPPFLASGFITGITLGIICEYFCRKSQWYKGKLGIKSKYTVSPHVQITHNKLHSPFLLPHLSFLAGLIMMVIFLINRQLESRALLFLFFCLLVKLSGKKINILITFTVMAGIVFFNLLAPYGKVLAAFGTLRITQGSLITGLEKAFALGGLAMLSRACIQSNLRLPGTMGMLLGESLQMLELMREKKNYITKRNVISGIDSMMLELETTGTVNNAETPQKIQLKNIVILSIIVLIAAVLGFTPRLCNVTLF